MGGKRLSGWTITRIRAKWGYGEPCSQVAEELGVSDATVRYYTEGLERAVKPPRVDGEEWLPVAGYGGGYLVSSFGRVFASRRSGRARLLKAKSGRFTCARVCLSDGVPRWVHVCVLVAQHFCDGRDADNCRVAHVNGNIRDDRASNLAWTPEGDGYWRGGWRGRAASPLNEREQEYAAERWLAGDSKGSIAHDLGRTRDVVASFLDGVRKGPISVSDEKSVLRVHGAPRPGSRSRRLTREQVMEIRSDGRSSRQLAGLYGVDKSTINRARRGDHYRDVPLGDAHKK